MRTSSHDLAMRSRDEIVFSKTAQLFVVWILVRETNPTSLEFIDHKLYQPKPITCKPKTAKNSVRHKTIMGLVADPFRWPEAYAGQGKDALTLWKEFCALHGLGVFLKLPTGGFKFVGSRSGHTGYAINTDPDSKHEGCLTFEGKYLYSDYDLFDIVSPPAAPGTGVFPLPGQTGVTPVQRRTGVIPVQQRTGVVPVQTRTGGIPIVGRPEPQTVLVGPKNLPHTRILTHPNANTQQFRVEDVRSQQWPDVSAFLNNQLGFELIQHGAHFDHDKDDFQTLRAFGPKGEIETWTAEQAAIKYREWRRV